MKQKTFTYTFYYWGGGAFIRRLLSLVGLLSRALLSGDLCPGGFCPIPVIVIFPNDHQYFNITYFRLGERFRNGWSSEDYNRLQFWSLDPMREVSKQYCFLCNQFQLMSNAKKKKKMYF
jgi:hypothetical protein